MDVKLSGTFACQEAVESKFLKLCSECSLESSDIAKAVAGWRKQTDVDRFSQFMYRRSHSSVLCPLQCVQILHCPEGHQLRTEEIGKKKEKSRNESGLERLRKCAPTSCDSFGL